MFVLYNIACSTKYNSNFLLGNLIGQLSNLPKIAQKKNENSFSLSSERTSGNRKDQWEIGNLY